MTNIFLIGFMGSGKSSVASYLSREYKMEIVEMDQLIVEREGMSIADIFAKHGEHYFRDIETNLLIEIQGEQNQVVSCGGGVVLREQNVSEMRKSGQIVLLAAKAETILERVKGNDDRPLLQGNKNVDFISEMMEKRRERYEQAADVVVHTDGKEIAQICHEILERIETIGE